ncbi:MAG: DUF2147 domain-containing protein [Rhodoferax sp.]|nr:DUF2147 domain-containing protein [Rhodoferax sp.]
MLRSLVIASFALSAVSAMAQMTPVGLWKTLSDDGKIEKSEVRVVDNNGIVSGKIERILDPKAKPGEVCDKCTDERKDKPMLGLEIIRGMKKVEGKDVWEDGKILDPENGKDYTLRLTPVEGGKKLEMRGSFFGIGRTQTWIRIQ